MHYKVITFHTNIYNFFTRNLLSLSKIVLKLAYGNVKFQTFPGVIAPDPRFKGRGRYRDGRGREGRRGEGKEKIKKKDRLRI